MPGPPREITRKITFRVNGKDELITKGDAVIYGLSLGATVTIACNAAGLHKQRYYDYLTAAAELEDIPDADLDAGQLEMRRFAEAASKAQDECFVYALEMVKKAMPHSWQAAMTLLERRQPKDFSRREKIEHSGKVDVDESIKERIKAVLGDLESSRSSSPSG